MIYNLEAHEYIPFAVLQTTELHNAPAKNAYRAYKQKVSEKLTIFDGNGFFFPPRTIYSREKKKRKRTSDATKRRQLNRDERNKKIWTDIPPLFRSRESWESIGYCEIQVRVKISWKIYGIFSFSSSKVLLLLAFTVYRPRRPWKIDVIGWDQVSSARYVSR